MNWPIFKLKGVINWARISMDLHILFWLPDTMFFMLQMCFDCTCYSNEIFRKYWVIFLTVRSSIFSYIPRNMWQNPNDFPRLKHEHLYIFRFCTIHDVSLYVSLKCITTERERGHFGIVFNNRVPPPPL